MLPILPILIGHIDFKFQRTEGISNSRNLILISIQFSDGRFQGLSSIIQPQ